MNLNMVTINNKKTIIAAKHAMVPVQNSPACIVALTN